MSQSVKVPDPVHEKARKVKEEYDYSSLGEAIRQMCSEGSFEV